MLSVNRADVLAVQQWFRIQVRRSFGVRDKANCDAEPVSCLARGMAPIDEATLVHVNRSIITWFYR